MPRAVHRRTQQPDAQPAPERSPQATLAEAYRLVFTSDAGQRVLDDLDKRFGQRRSFAADSHLTAFNEGQRDVYLLIRALVSRDLGRDREGAA